MYTSDTSAAVLGFVNNDALSSLSKWFKQNYLAINPEKTQALIVGPSKYNYTFLIDDALVFVSAYLKILGVTLDKKLSFKDHISLQLGKVYKMTAALRRSRRFIPYDTMKSLYKAFILPHFEYCAPLLLGKGPVKTNGRRKFLRHKNTI